MSTKRILAVLFFCGFALPTVSVKTCEKKLQERESCIIKLPTEIQKKFDANKGEIKWTFTSSSSSWVAQRKNGKDVKTYPNATIESDGSLKFWYVNVSNTGKYTFEAYDNEDKMVANHKEDITVYAKALKPTVKRECISGNVTLTCDTQKNDKTDLTITWIKGTVDIKDANKADLFQTFQQLQENTQYSCRVHNPVSTAQSDVFTVSCEDDTRRTLFGYDFWIMVGILSGGGALLLLLIFVLVICAGRSCKQREKDEEELRLRSFDTSPTNRQRAKVTARGQPAPPIPQEDSYPATQTPPQTQNHAKGPVRARPPPPPQDEDEEDPPPLPRPRKKREKRAEEPYRPME